MTRTFLRFSPCCCALFLVTLTLFGGFASPAVATDTCSLPLDLTCQFNPCRSPASGVPSTLWGELAPVDLGELPDNRDSTDLNATAVIPNAANSRWLSLDIEGSTLFAGISYGLEIWDIGGANADDPEVQVVLGRNSFPYWKAGFGEEKNPVRDVDAPEGNDDVLAVALVFDSGISVFDTTSKKSPVGKYADRDRNALQVYSTRIGSSDYAFLATRDRGFLAYNLTTAKGLALRCVDNSPASTSCGPYVGKIGARNDTSYVDGAGNFVVLSSGNFILGLELWNVSNPAAPTRVIEALTSERVHGVAMWRKGSSYYLGTVIRLTGGGGIQARIYNVSCLSGGSCGSLGSPIWTQTLPGGGSEYFLTYSRSLTQEFLSLGTVNVCTQSTQNEWLFDVTSPAAPNPDITPPDGLVGGQTTGYWGWYYRRSPTGFNNTAGRMGKFSGQFFYRAALNVFDVHMLTGGLVPNASFNFTPAQVYRDEEIDFFDTSLGGPSSWSWTFQDGSPATSVAQNPQNVAFSSTGSKTVSLTASNGNGPDTANQQINVLDPAATVTVVTVAPNPALLCQPITFNAEGVDGLPPLNLSWIVRDGLGAQVDTGGNENPFEWDTEAALVAAGTYTAEVTVMNAVNSVSATSPVLTLDPLAPLSFTSPGGMPETLNGPPFSSGTVNFQIQATGATEWRWNFADGTPPVWTNNPVTGPAPSHSYANTGTYPVTVEIRNCQQAAIASSAASVVITVVAPLVAQFQALSICAFGPCSTTVNQAITFQDTSSGNPDFYDYDWDGNGTFEDSGNPAPVTTHTYTATGFFSPRLKVRRGLESHIDIHSSIQVTTGGGGGGGTPSVSVGGPASAQVGTSLNFSASASNCTPSPASWSWTVGTGGTISGATTGSSITVSYSSTGTKVVRATANGGGCNGTNGSKTVTITGGGGGGGTLNAAFVFAPSSPDVGEAVVFNSTSIGSPDQLDWTFGDGSSISDGGSSVNHTYTAAGSYTVTLEITRFNDPSCPPFNTCTDTESKQVVVTGNGGGGGGGNNLTASYTVDVPCEPFAGGLELCKAEVGQLVTLTSTSQGATSTSWVFGDGGTATTPVATHSWATTGQFVVTVRVQDDNGGAVALAKIFEISEATVVPSGVVIVPYIIDATGVIDQDSDLFVTNPTDEEMEVDITFRKRGLPDVEPPVVTRTIPAHGTLLALDAITSLYGLEDIGGFLVIETEAEVAPVAVLLNRTRQSDGTQFGQVVPGLTEAELEEFSAAAGGKQYLLGLNDTDERLTTFGLTNPHPGLATYRLRFFDSAGAQLGVVSDLQTLAPWGQKQFRIQEIRAKFGIIDVADYRVEIEQLSGETLYAFAGLIRKGTLDLSFIRVSVPNLEKIYLFGAANTPGANNSQFATDILLSNPTNVAMAVSATYLNVGFGNPEPPVTSTIQPNGTLRIGNMLQAAWGVSGVGVLTFESTGAGGLFPMIHGETFQDGGVNSRFGLFMPARRESEIARVGQKVFLSGLRKLDDDSNTTLWFFNPEPTPGRYTIVYRALDGSELGRTASYAVGAGGMRQINPSKLGLPVGGVEGGFSVEVEVNAGGLLLAAQVVITQTNDPAFVAGVIRE